MQLTQSDASAIQSTARHVGVWNRDIVTDSELVSALFHNFYNCESDAGVEQCVALVPTKLWPDIESKIVDVLGRSHPGELFVYQPIIPAAAVLEQLDDRVRHVMEVVTNYLANPTGIVEYEIDYSDGSRQRWCQFKLLETVDGEFCRKANCPEDRIRNAVFCRAHQYETIYGQLPPE